MVHATRLAERVADLVARLADGWDERIEFQIEIRSHVALCQVRRAAMTPAGRKHHHCGCPAHLEARARTARQLPLLVQLQQAVSEPQATVTSDAGSADQAHSSPPGNPEALELLLRVKAVARDAYERLRAELYPDHTGPARVTAPNALHQVADWCAMASDGTVECGDDLVYEIKEELRRLVRTARVVLGYDVPQRMLADTVCGDCGGALIVADDASSDVRCIGSPEAPGCGTTYYRWEWISLLEGEGA